MKIGRKYKIKFWLFGPFWATFQTETTLYSICIRLHSLYTKNLKKDCNFGFMKIQVSLYTLLFLLIAHQGLTQRNVKDSIISSPLLGFQYGGNATQGDLADRFGYLNHVGILAGYKTSKNWFWGIDANYHFGSRIRIADPLAELRDSKGNITDQNGDIANVFLTARGFNANIAVGKLIPVLSPNVNSGILIHGGVGYLAYKLRIDTPDHVVPQIELDYRKGYDRLTNGINFHQFIGYLFLANRGFVNFYGGFYAQEGLTRNQRSIFFDTPNVPVSKAQRLDIQLGFKLGWIVPVYKRVPKNYYID
jgi:hypothetical protein